MTTGTIILLIMLVFTLVIVRKIEKRKKLHVYKPVKTKSIKPVKVKKIKAVKRKKEV